MSNYDVSQYQYEVAHDEHRTVVLERLLDQIDRAPAPDKDKAVKSALSFLLSMIPIGLVKYMEIE
jgi:hypothetical protein